MVLPEFKISEEMAPELEEIVRRLEKNKTEVSVQGVGNSALSYLLASMRREIMRPYLIICPSQEGAEGLYDDLRTLSNDDVCLFPAWEVLPYEDISPHHQIVSERLVVLNKLLSGEAAIVVTWIRTLQQNIIPPDVLRDSYIPLKVGQTVSLNDIQEKLVEGGYRRVGLTEERGDFSARGGIIDVYSTSYQEPLRIELFGDEVESIRFFDLGSQRTLRSVEEIVILPRRELPLNKGHIERGLKGIKSYRPPGKQDPSPGTRKEMLQERIATVIEKIDSLNYFEGSEKYMPFFYPQLASLLDYIPSDTLMVIADKERIRDEAGKFTQQIAVLYEEALERDEVAPPPETFFEDSEQLLARFESHQRLSTSILESEKEGVEVNSTSPPAFNGQVKMVAQEIKAWLKDGKSVFIFCRNKGQERRLKELLKDEDLEVDSDDGSLSEGGISERGRAQATIVIGVLRGGFILADWNIVVLTDDDIFGRYREQARHYRHYKEAEPLTSFVELKEGDYVVHLDHGVGIYRGMKRMETDGALTDFVLIEYAGNDKLYVRSDKVRTVGKYIGNEGVAPKLYRLGGADWTKEKENVKRAIRRMADELLKLYATREALSGHRFSSDTVWQHEFESSFIYDETPDQIKSQEEMKMDMEAAKPMDRLICGDVGYGKTEVAIRAAFKVVMDGKQVGVLVPTTILAQQHFNTFRERMADYPINIAMLSRFKTTKEQREIVKGLNEGTIDIVIGTHRLIQKDVEFKDLGLVIIDEEQRFGVRHKERLKKLRTLVDVLTLTATPIPRTLHMSLMGARDMSLIATPPPDRFPIQTMVSKYDENIAREAILREIGRGGQVFYVHNRVQTINNAAARLGDLVPEARIAVAHGQMHEHDLEGSMLDFMHKKHDILVCTTIIESGLDIPNANTIIVMDADRFGLSQLYQLRGRVGRSKHRAYAYLFYRGEGILSEVAEKRLAAMREFSELGSGFRLAMRDLEIRGTGNILGSEQHGHIVTLGFDLYCRLLKDTVDDLKGDLPQEEVQPELNLQIDTYIPDDYVPDERSKFYLYKKIAALSEDAQIDDLRAEFRDRYGPIPDSIDKLIKVARLRLLAKKASIKSMDQKDQKVIINFTNQVDSVEGIAKVAQKYSNIIKLIPKKDRLSMSVDFLSKDENDNLDLVSHLLAELSE